MPGRDAFIELSLIAKSLSEHLNDAIWNGVRNASGDTTKDLFNGFDTITQKKSPHHPKEEISFLLTLNTYLRKDYII